MVLLPERHPIRGFTLLELLTVIMIISVLATITVVSIRAIQDRANRQFTKTVILIVDTAFTNYSDSQGVYPDISSNGWNVHRCLERLKLTTGLGAIEPKKGTAKLFEDGGKVYICDFWRQR